jgi:fatty acid desaturase
MSDAGSVTEARTAAARATAGGTAPESGAARTASPPAWRAVLTAAERKDLERIDPLRAWGTIAVNWGLVFAAMALVARWASPLTIVVALFVIGARQLGMAVVMHEAAHRTLFASRRLNDWVGSWLAAYPVWTDIEPYRPYHLQHHAKTGTEGDPDLGLVRPFPITRRSFRRKVWRDLSGQTGVKQAIAVFRRDVGIGGGRTQRNLAMSEGVRPDVGWHKVAPVAIANAALLAVLWLAGHPALYLLWVAAWLTTYRLLTRIRSIAEHSMVPDQRDPARNTRTTRARWWERLLIAPNRVNFHLEHHLLVAVPHYNLPRLHRILRARGALEGCCVADGYLSVLRLAVSRPEA